MSSRNVSEMVLTLSIMRGIPFRRENALNNGSQLPLGLHFAPALFFLCWCPATCACSCSLRTTAEIQRAVRKSAHQRRSAKCRRAAVANRRGFLVLLLLASIFLPPRLGGVLWSLTYLALSSSNMVGCSAPWTWLLHSSHANPILRPRSRTGVGAACWGSTTAR